VPATAALPQRADLGPEGHLGALLLGRDEAADEQRGEPGEDGQGPEGPRQPVSRPAKEPTGTPMTLARVRPPIMRPMARAEFRGPAAVVATAAPTDQNAPVARAVTTRAARTTAKEPLRTATT
jgi:hypothetical protein